MFRFASSRQSDGVQKNGPALKVLIVDDSPLIRERLNLLLSELEQVEIVGPAEDGDEALRLFHGRCPRLV